MGKKQLTYIDTAQAGLRRNDVEQLTYRGEMRSRNTWCNFYISPLATDCEGMVGGWQLKWTRLSLMGRSNSAADVFDLSYICDKCKSTENQSLLSDLKNTTLSCLSPFSSSSQTIMCVRHMLTSHALFVWIVLRSAKMKSKGWNFELDWQDYFEYLSICQSGKIEVAFKVHTSILIPGIFVKIIILFTLGFFLLALGSRGAPTKTSSPKK